MINKRFFKFFNFFLLSIGFLYSTVDAAAPGTHAYFGMEWINANTFKNETDKDLFIAGTLFPDIRYLGTIKRNETHDKKATAPTIRANKDVFLAGMQLHAYVDGKREKYVKESNIESHLKKIPKKSRVLFLKLLEDEILWSKIQTDRAILIMNSIYNEEIKFGVDEETILTWHQSMLDYFKQPPSAFLKDHANKNEGFLQADATTVKEWVALLPVYAKNPVFQNYTRKMTQFVISDF